MLKKYGLSLIALIAGCALLTACNKYVAQTDKKIESTLERIEEYNQQAQIPAMPEETDTVRMHDDIWLGDQSVKLMEGEGLPSWFEKDDGITLSIASDATLTDLAQQISDLTNITVRMDDLRLSEAVPEDGVTVRYSGRLSELLNYLANRYNVYWNYHDKVINFFANETRIFTIYALPTETQINASLTGASMGEGSANTSLSTSADLTLWTSIEEGVKQIMGDKGQVSFARSTGSISVTASPYIIQKVAKYVNSWNEKLSRQVAVTVRILSVELNNADNYGLNLDAVFNSNLSLGFKSATTATTATSGILSMAFFKEGNKFSGSNGFIQALSTQGKTRQVTSASMTTMNNKVAPLQVTQSRNYIKQINTTTSSSNGENTTDKDIETDTLTTGLTINVLPRILNHGRLLLLLSFSFTHLDNMEPVSVDGTEMHLPDVSTKGFLQEVAMQSGMTLVLTGFEQVADETETTGVGKAKMGLLGGRADNINTHKVLVILVTPEILQSPLSPEALMNSQ